MATKAPRSSRLVRSLSAPTLVPAAALLSLAALTPACEDRVQVLGSSDGGSGAADRGQGGDASGLQVEGIETEDGSFVGPACANSTFEATLRPLVLYILLDQSGSMKETDDRWTPVSQAISEFIQSNDAAGVNVALQYFALGASTEVKCDAATYAMPEVEPQELPGGSELLEASLAAHDFPQSDCCTNDNEHNGTPTRPAVEGALGYLDGYLTENPDHAAVLLLATDGAPTSDCDDNDVNDVASAIAASATARLPVSTYVIGIGEEDSLGAMAEAGGTGVEPFLVDGTGSSTQQEFAAALAAIRGRAIPCDFEFPSGGNVDPDKVNLSYSPSAGDDVATALFIDGPEDCDAAVDQWYYDLTSGERRIQLCPRFCQSVTESNEGQVDIVIGCATRVR